MASSFPDTPSVAQTTAPAAAGPAVTPGAPDTPATPGTETAALPKAMYSDCRSGRSYSLSGGETPGQVTPGGATPRRRHSYLTTDDISHEMVGGRDEVTFVPFAMYREGNRIHAKSVGWHSDGEVVVMREEISSASEAEVTSKSWLTDTRRIEKPIPEADIVAKGLRAIPGTLGPRGKKKRRRWKRTFLIDDDEEDDSPRAQGPRPGRLTKADFQELFTVRGGETEFGFHDESGPVRRQWLPYVEISMDKQDRLLRGMTRKQPQPTEAKAKELTPQQRVARIQRPVKAELTSVSQRRTLFLPPVEERLREYLEGLRAAGSAERRPLVLVFEDSFHRMLFHGVCAYYGFVSESHTDEEGVRCTVVELPADVDPEDTLSAPLLADQLAKAPQCQGHVQPRRRRKYTGRR